MENTIEKLAQVIEAPSYEIEPTEHRLFLAGGITNCPDWQTEMISELQGFPDLTIFNPRRAEYPDDPEAVVEQINWEYDFLESATVIVVWFSRGSVNPITLYELGIWVNARPQIPAFIGIDPDYERSLDVITQTKRARPEIEPVFSLKALASQVRRHLNH